MAAAANHYLRAAFFSHLGRRGKKSYFLTFASREVNISETGHTCLHEAANTNTDPSECIRYFTTILQLAEQTVTHAREPLRTTLSTMLNTTLYWDRVKLGCRSSSYILFKNSMTGLDFKEIALSYLNLKKNVLSLKRAGEKAELPK